MNNPTHFEIIGIGNAIVDLLCDVSDDFLERHHLIKSTMRLCTHSEQHELLADLPDAIVEAGGSVGNTMTSLGALGVVSGFIGTVSRDHWGDLYISSMENNNVSALIETLDGEESTGTSVIVVTPDSERTMNTHLGASALFTQNEMNEHALSSCEMCFIEGYAYDSEQQRNAVEHATRVVRDNRGRVALTLSDALCVQRHKAEILDLVQSVDILLCNAQEFLELFGTPIDTLSVTNVEHIRTITPALVVVTRSELGCTIIENALHHVPAKIPERLVDVTGAGDQFAAGLLYGLIRGCTPDQSSRLGIELATAVISKMGPRLSKEEIEPLLKRWTKTADTSL